MAAEISLFSYTLPEQRTTRNAKSISSFYRPTYDNIITRALALNNKDNVRLWLEAANGEVSNESIKYLTSPFVDKQTKQEIGTLPGEIRSTDLINTVRERNLGEYLGLPYKYEVTVENDDVILQRDARVKREIDKVVQQAIINELNEIYQEKIANGEDAINLNVTTEDIPDLKTHVEKTISEYFDDRAIQGQALLELINTTNNFDIKRIQSFFYWWACEEFYTYREIINGEVITEIISPMDGYPIMGNEQFIEDADAFVIKRQITLSQLKSRYWDKLDKKEQEYINTLVRTKGGYYTAAPEFLRSRVWSVQERTHISQNLNAEFRVTNSDELLDEYIVIWRTEVPVTIKTSIDLYGAEYDEIVDDDYVIDTTLDKLRTEYIEEVWIGRRFGNATTGVYMQPEPCSVQRYNKATNRCKLPVGGKKGLLRDIKQNPIPNRLVTFELIDRIYGLQIERTLAKYQPYILTLPQSMINPDDSGTSAEKMFYIKADNTLIYNDAEVDFQTVVQGLRGIALPSVADYLNILVELKKANREEGLQMANMNSYRLGDVSPSTGKGVMQESIYRAAVGNVLSLVMFNAALERDHNADLEFGKIAYVQGRKTSFYSKDLKKTIYLDVDPMLLLETDFGVYCHNAKLDQSKIDKYTDLAFAAAQNGEFELAAAAIDADTVPQIRTALRKIIDAKKEFEVRIAKEQNEATTYAADRAAETATAQQELEREIAYNRDNKDITVAQIQANSQETGSITEVPINTNNNNAIVDKFYKDRELFIKKQMHDDDIRFKRDKMKSDEKIAKNNKNKYDK